MSLNGTGTLYITKNVKAVFPKINTTVLHDPMLVQSQFRPVGKEEPHL